MQAPVYRTVVGALREYDLPDLVAVAASKQGPSDSPPRGGVLVLGPRSAMLSSLSQPCTYLRASSKVARAVFTWLVASTQPLTPGFELHHIGSQPLRTTPAIDKTSSLVITKSQTAITIETATIHPAVAH